MRRGKERLPAPGEWTYRSMDWDGRGSPLSLAVVRILGMTALLLRLAMLGF